MYVYMDEGGAISTWHKEKERKFDDKWRLINQRSFILA